MFAIAAALHSTTALPIVPAMRMRALSRPFHLALAFVLAAAAACGNRVAADPRNREIPWTYGPTTGGATEQHVQGTGRNGGAAIARGWQCRLLDGKRLTITPYQLATSHALFGKVAMMVGLFDKTGAPVETLRAGTITAQDATFTLEISEDAAQRLQDLVIWYCEP